jgi:hypothetical protein
MGKTLLEMCRKEEVARAGGLAAQHLRPAASFRRRIRHDTCSIELLISF